MQRKTLAVIVVLPLLLAAGWYYTQDRTLADKVNHKLEVTTSAFSFPPGITPSAEQTRSLLDIQAKYSAQLSALASARQNALAAQGDAEKARAFYRQQEKIIWQEVDKAIDSLLTPEQREALRKR